MPIGTLSVQCVATLIAVHGYEKGKSLITFQLTHTTAPAWLETSGESLAKLAMIDPVGYCIHGLSQILQTTITCPYTHKLKPATINDLMKLEPIEVANDKAHAYEAAKSIHLPKIVACNDLIRQLLSLTASTMIDEKDFVISFEDLSSVVYDEDAFDLLVLQLRDTLTNVSLSTSKALGSKSLEALRLNKKAATNYILQKSKKAKHRNNKLWMRYQLNLDDDYLATLSEAVMNEPTISKALASQYGTKLTSSQKQSLRTKLDKARVNAKLTRAMGFGDLSTSELTELTEGMAEEVTKPKKKPTRVTLATPLDLKANKPSNQTSNNPLAFLNKKTGA